MTWNQHFLKVTLCEKSTFCCILSEMNIFVVARSRDNKYEFFAYVISQKRRVTLRKKLQNSVAEVKRSPHTKIQLFLSTLKMAKKSRGRSCPRPFKWLELFPLPQRMESYFIVVGYLYTWVERGTLRVICLGQLHDTLTLVRVWIWTDWSKVQNTN